MHGSGSGSALLVNAEVDSMGGIVDGGVGIDIKTSPRTAAIERAQADLTQEHNFREACRRELEFLAKGGNPLDFSIRNGASLSVQSTSLADLHPEHFVTSEAKGSFARSASPHGDSVVSEPNTADNLLLLDGVSESDRNRARTSTPTTTKRNSTIIPRKHGSHMDGTQNAEDSAIVRPYARRNRSKPNRDGARSSSTVMIQTRGSRDASSISEVKAQNVTVVECNNQKSATSNCDMLNVELEGAPSKEEMTKDRVPEAKLDISTLPEEPKRLIGDQHKQPADTDAQKTLSNMASEDPNLVDRKEEVVPVKCQATTTKVENDSHLGLPNGNGGQNSSATMGMKGFDSEHSCNQDSLTLVVNNDNMSLNPRNVVSNKEQASELEGTKMLSDGDLVNEKDIIKAAVGGSSIKVEEEARQSMPDLQNDVEQPCNVSAVKSDRKMVDDSGSNGVNKDICKSQRLGDRPVSEPVASTSGRNSSAVTDVAMVDKAHEDSILEEARIIEAKQKRIAQLSAAALPLEYGQKSLWNFVLEEMAWLANDFAQERLWKMTAAAQISRRAAFTSQLRSDGKTQTLKLKKIAYTLAKAVMQFWHSAEMPQSSSDPTSGVESCRQDVSGDKAGVEGHEIFKEAKIQGPKNQVLAVQNYAARFLKSNCYHAPCFQAEAPATPDRMSDLGVVENSWNENVIEENLFYAIPSKAMESYRKSIESHFMQCEKSGSSMLEEVETSMYDTFDGDEGETSAYYMSGGLEGRKSAKPSHKIHKNSIKLNNSRTYEARTDIPYGHCTNGTQQSVKRPASSLHVGSFPTKRVRTASRQRVVSPFNVGAIGSLQVPARTDASSGDTNSFQDDQSTLHGGSQIQKSMEVGSIGGFEKQPPYDYAETSTKPKKKKAKTPGVACEQGWQVDNAVHASEQRDHSRKRLDSHHFESNGSSGLYGQHCAKKPKMMKQQVDSSFDNVTPIMGSIPSPAASQMSNMPNPNKLIKLISGRDRSRKVKGLKVTSGQASSGSSWSLFEDQALVVLVHDMGPNWELVSDAINSTLQFKCIHRKPKECKERHKSLMDRSAGDGAESADDSGSSQSYTLPGIPKGSARQLFQHLQGPMEEDTLRSHFEKIIMIGKKLHQRKFQNESQDSKHIVPVHNSHVIALSQVCPNNPNGGFLTPLDLCDAAASSPDVLPFGYHSGGPAVANQGGVASSMLTGPGTNSSLQVTPDMLLTNSVLSPSSSINSSMRDGRYNVPRTSVPVDEQQRTHQYNQMFAARNIQQSDLSVPGPDRGGVRMLPGGNGMGMMANRSMPMARPGLRGIASQSMLNSGSMVSSSGVGMPSPVNIHTGAVTGQGTSVLRPREAMHVMRPGQNAEHHQRQLMAPELQMQPAFNGLSSPLSSQSGSPSPPVQTFPQQSHRPRPQGPNHSAGAQHQYAVRIAKQHRYIQQQKQQQQFSSSGPLMQQAQAQLPKSSQTASQSVPSMSPMPAQLPQKHHLAAPPGGLNRNPQTNNQMGKPRQRQQQIQQTGRPHPQQRQHPQAKAMMKETSRRGGSLNASVEPPQSHPNGLSIPIPSPQGQQGLYSPVQPSSNHTQSPQQKLYSGQMPASKSIPQRPPSLSDNNNKNKNNNNNNNNNNISSSQIPFPSGPQQRRVTQNNSPAQRLLIQNRQLDQAQAERQQPMNNSSTTTVIPPTSIVSTNVAPVSEPGTSNVATQSGSPPHTTSTNCDLTPAVSPGSLPVSVGSDVQQSSSPQQNPQQEQPVPKDQQQSPQQLPLLHDSQQVGQGSLYIRPSSSKPE
ncbi:hypothetical protein ACFE04_029357 [Oxalis oulophora]